MDYTPAVLRNKGVPVQIASVREENGDWVPIFDAEGEQETEELFIKFTHNTIADIEEVWDGLEEWQSQMEIKPVSTLRRTLALIMRESVDVVGSQMIEGRLPEYSNAIGVAWAIANGVDPTMASRLLTQAEVALDTQIKTLNEELGENLAELEKDTPGNKPSQPGAKPAKTTKSSGKKAPPKS